jgi:hypothetical protein
MIGTNHCEQRWNFVMNDSIFHGARADANSGALLVDDRAMRLYLAPSCVKLRTNFVAMTLN